MEIDAIAFRILKFLKDKNPSETITESKVLQGIKCNNRNDFNNSVSALFEMKLIDLTKSSISITNTGALKFKQIKDEQDELAHKNVYRDYDYCILEFLFVNNWGVRIEEFPESILAEAKQEGTYYPEGNLGNYLHRNGTYIDFIGNEYFLNEQGKKRYSTLTVQKEEEKERKNYKINIQKIKNNKGILIQDSESSESPMTQSVTTTPSIKQSAPKKKRWYNSPLFKYFIWPLLVVLIGYLIINFI